MKEFVPYNEAIKLKELGFDEECFKYYTDTGELYVSNLYGIHAPIFSQAFKFFREKYQWQSYIEPTSDQHNHELGYNYCLWNSKTGEEYNTMPQNCPSGDWEFEKYEDAELACLIKLIELIKNK